MSTNDDGKRRAHSEWMYNKHIYQKLKLEGQLRLGEWVIIANGILIHSAKSEQDALKILYESDVVNCYFAQVGTSHVHAALCTTKQVYC